MRARFSMSAFAFVVMLGLIALCLPKSSFAQDISGFVSDDFSATQLDTITWSVIDPRGDSTVSVAENRLRITVPAGTNHDMPNNGDNTAARVMQPIFNTDFELEVKFESPVQAGQIQGIMVEQEAGTTWCSMFTTTALKPAFNPFIHQQCLQQQTGEGHRRRRPDLSSRQTRGQYLDPLLLLRRHHLECRQGSDQHPGTQLGRGTCRQFRRRQCTGAHGNCRLYVQHRHPRRARRRGGDCR